MTEQQALEDIARRDVALVLEELERSLAWIDRESFVVDYGVIQRGAGGLGVVVEWDTAMHALLFVRKRLRDLLTDAQRPVT